MTKKVNHNESVKENRALEIWKQFCRNKGAVIGLTVTIILILVSLFSNVIWDYDTDVIGINIPDRLMEPCLEHPFGTDQYGRDMLARVGYGTRYSLIIGISSTAIALILGLPIGAAAGYLGGKFDDLFMRVVDAITIIPSILLTVILVSILGTSLVNLILALSISSIPILARIARASVLTVRNNEYVESARAIGGNGFYIVMTQILPNCFSPILVRVTLQVASGIVAASSLSFLGIGVPVPSPEWGALLSAGRGLIRQATWLTIFPGLAIMITVLSLNLLGDGLRDALDPKLKK